MHGLRAASAPAAADVSALPQHEARDGAALRPRACPFLDRAPAPAPIGFAEPPVVVLVALDEGIRLVSNLEGAETADLAIGLPVEVTFAPTRGGHAVPVFRRVGRPT
jgi:hypothetical protein